MDMKKVNSTELFQDLCVKVVISLKVMVLVENLFMETNFQMRISKESTLVKESYLWLMQDLTPMDLNSFYVQLKQHGWMENT